MTRVSAKRVSGRAARHGSFSQVPSHITIAKSKRVYMMAGAKNWVKVVLPGCWHRLQPDIECDDAHWQGGKKGKGGLRKMIVTGHRLSFPFCLITTFFRISRLSC